MKSNDIRKSFLEFFRSKGHVIVPSAPIIIKDDPTLLFTNSGMNQFKDLFLGNVPVKHPRIADTQKCLRVSGKHNDLEEVGVDTYHHTMFEMLGNWSFGDYFKKEAIDWAWELLAIKFAIPEDRLYVTVFEGSKEDHLEFDQEAFDIWKSHLPVERIINGSKKDNFWEMGDTGPCGPCSEIHVDLRPDDERKKTDGKSLVNKDHPQVVEIWNNVFMEFNRKANGSLEKLPARHVDTGMGFERLCMVLQGKSSTYDTDVFEPLINKIESVSGIIYKPSDRSPASEPANIAIRVIADHIRAIAFAIADGQLPSNTGAGYVIRRILRRAVRYGYQSLDLKEPFLYKLLPDLVRSMGEAFPELTAQKGLIEKVIREEEVGFFRTLDLGIARIEQVCKSTLSRNEKIVDGTVVFELYDTYGFPVDLTALIAKGYGLSIDEEKFYSELEKQKARSRSAASMDTEDWVVINGQAETVFTGYDSLEERANIIKYRKVKSRGKELFQIVLNKTPFYAESGGQVGDTGYLEIDGERIPVLDTKREHGTIIHLTEKFPSNPAIDLMARVDGKNRKLTACNHSATHLLHSALRMVLGNHVQQKGSLVNSEYLRFDFSHFSKVTDEEILRVEKIVNQKIRENITQKIAVMPFEEARKTGAMALFGEKYGDKVRVVTFDPDFSIELCGGTHATSTGELGFFKIISESAVAAGVRRIEAITADKAEAYFYNCLDALNQIKNLLKQPKEVVNSVQELLNKNLELSREIESYQIEKARKIKEFLINKIERVKGVNFLAEKVEGINQDQIKNISFEIKDQFDHLFMVIGSESQGKASLALTISEDLVKERGLNAGAIIKDLSREINGGGGGQAFFATAGGTNPRGLKALLESAVQFID